MNGLRQVSAMVETIFESAAITDIGLARSLNEDSVAVVRPREPDEMEKGSVLVVADGLGGHNAGEVASSLVTECLPRIYHNELQKDCAASLLHAVTACNTLVHDASLRSPDLQGMGTTVVAAVILNQYAVFVNVGDSRGYLLREGSIIHRTKDHSLKDATADVPGMSNNRFSHVLTRAIGPKPNVPIDITTHRIARGDVIVLCTDGLSDHVSDEEMKDIVFSHQSDEAARMLIDLAKQRGGEDNITVIVAHVQSVHMAESSNPTHAGLHRYLVS